MKINPFILTASLTAVLFSVSSVYSSENDALLKLLVNKGILTQEEAASVSEELAREAAQEREEINEEIRQEIATSTPESKLSLSKNIEKLKIYGDVRGRYQYENAQDQLGDNNDRSRWRYRLRLGATFDFESPWSAGVRLESNNDSNSTNVDFGGFFDKENDELFIGLIYLEYDGFINARLGKHRHPFHISKAFWDSDLNPEGISESITFENLLENWDITFNAGQYIIDNENESRTNPSGANVDDDFMLVLQTEGKTQLEKLGGGTLTIAPLFMVTTGGQTSTTTSETGSVSSSTFFHDFAVLQFPIEYKFKDKHDRPHKFFGTYGINLKGDDLVNNPAFGAGGRSRNQFFNIGYQYGKAKKAGTWQAGIEYRYIEAASYSPNLVDSDFGANGLNQHGFVLGGRYAFTDWFYGAITYYISNNIVGDLDTEVSPFNTVDIVQVDLNWKF